MSFGCDYGAGEEPKHFPCGVTASSGPFCWGFGALLVGHTPGKYLQYKQRAVGPRLFSASGESLKTNADLPSTSERVGSPRNADGNRKGKETKER
mgnify:CR=1 FL=1